MPVPPAAQPASSGGGAASLAHSGAQVLGGRVGFGNALSSLYLAGESVFSGPGGVGVANARGGWVALSGARCMGARTSRARTTHPVGTPPLDTVQLGRASRAQHPGKPTWHLVLEAGVRKGPITSLGPEAGDSRAGAWGGAGGEGSLLFGTHGSGYSEGRLPCGSKEQVCQLMSQVLGARRAAGLS